MKGHRISCVGGSLRRIDLGSMIVRVSEFVGRAAESGALDEFRCRMRAQAEKTCR